ncbi:hypothetical protein [Gemmata sp.]|uniref:hypothetical protein n=1 Tax=Gemmata sp. TaxID=1914242 RepID=UPI003F727431
MKSLRTIILSLLLVVAIGCHQPEPSISGKITYQGKVPALGQVTFVDEQGNGLNTILAEDGTYLIRPARVGTMRVMITSMSNLPAKYRDPKTTDLTVEIKPGENAYSIDIP